LIATLRHKLDPKHRVQILTLYGAARRVYARHFSERDADTGTLFWSGWHVTNTLRLPAPLVRLGVALERDPREIVDVIARYHPLTAREPAQCERAYLEFIGIYDQRTRKPLHVIQ